ncbi:hypothetical protein BABA_22713 [Neobacillus bataviensis LMG 21833]|uniref:Uncharacterized protein n=1 Tax=Neobacillus bataviensis LMG 21833 TaxID=1117379 RepID=K6D8U9_9BACI|nr:hypothetical protein [Neobacillus bataviensis]EKN64749.1 hypothetical protein BABA_22713 [Neobacillus bataviensis LMG 21833]
MNENKLKHLEFIQGVINRMGQNSFLLKGWAVTLVAGLFVFANTQEIDYRFISIALIPTIFFWFLDGYFLWQEKLFRKLYDHVRKKGAEEVVEFSMNVKPFEPEISSWIRICLSTTLSLFYFPILVIIIITMALVFK